jgi:hypothetical protein
LRRGEGFRELKRRRSLLAVVVAVVAGGVGLGVAALAGAFGEGRSHALYSFSNGWGVSDSKDAIGQVWAAGGVPLCTKGHSPVVLTSITPIEIEGQIRLERIVMRHAMLSNTIAIDPGTPRGSRPVAGYVIHSPSPCGWPGEALMNEAVVLAVRTGPYGGYIQGLRVDYKSGASPGSYVIPFTFGLCGSRDGGGPCSHRS